MLHPLKMNQVLGAKVAGRSHHGVAQVVRFTFVTTDCQKLAPELLWVQGKIGAVTLGVLGTQLPAADEAQQAPFSIAYAPEKAWPSLARTDSPQIRLSSAGHMQHRIDFLRPQGLELGAQLRGG